MTAEFVVDETKMFKLDDYKMLSKFEQNALEIGKLVTLKNQQYGDSFNNADKILKVLYPNGIQTSQYLDMLAIIRIIDKLFRLSNGDQGDESAYADIVGYGLLGMTKEKIE